MRENEREAYPACGRDIFPGRVGRCRYPAQGWLLSEIIHETNTTA
ncbi:hypothetical protein STBHUCCB_42210 [Salmonella enterica subsp. enterica serovar Typhi str. P-stx-12]|nr:hypothetical protein STBHUCCB_42210 [Salmonella enterica subsp. enterica serovar Typhi str. P-stx-12]AXR58764.1 hypothetical protein CJP42_4712 [Salmonella enterica subsp. enterica serovar Typhi]